MTWRDSAACAGVDPELFFTPDHPGRGGSSTKQMRLNQKHLAVALTICGRCPVQDDCYEEALANHEVGVWGGTTEEQRRFMRRLA